MWLALNRTRRKIFQLAFSTHRDFDPNRMSIEVVYNLRWICIDVSSWYQRYIEKKKWQLHLWHFWWMTLRINTVFDKGWHIEKDVKVFSLSTSSVYVIMFLWEHLKIYAERSGSQLFTESHGILISATHLTHIHLLNKKPTNSQPTSRLDTGAIHLFPSSMRNHSARTQINF